MLDGTAASATGYQELTTYWTLVVRINISYSGVLLANQTISGNQPSTAALGVLVRTYTR